MGSRQAQPRGHDQRRGREGDEQVRQAGHVRLLLRAAPWRGHERDGCREVGAHMVLKQLHLFKLVFMQTALLRRLEGWPAEKNRLTIFANSVFPPSVSDGA